MKRIIMILLSVVLFIIGVISLSKYCKRAQLEEKFLEDFMRYVPMEIFTKKTIGDFDVLYQEESLISDRYNYKNSYIIGKKGGSFFNYDYCFSLTGINIFENIGYITNVVKKFKTDTTHVYSISVKNDSLSIVASRKKENEYIAWKVCKTAFLDTNFKCNEDVWRTSNSNK